MCNESKFKSFRKYRKDYDVYIFLYFFSLGLMSGVFGICGVVFRDEWGLREEFFVVFGKVLV